MKNSALTLALRETLCAPTCAMGLLVVVFSAAGLSPGGASLAGAEEAKKLPKMIEVEAIDEWGDLLAMSLIDGGHGARNKAPCIVWDRVKRRVVWRREGVAFPHFLAEGKQVLGVRAGGVLVWHDTKSGKELRRRRVPLPKDWPFHATDGRPDAKDAPWNQIEGLALLADKKELMVTLNSRLFRHRLADGKTFFQPKDEKTVIYAKDGFTVLLPRDIRTPKDVQGRFVTMIDRQVIRDRISDSENFAEFVLWNSRTLRPIRRWAPKTSQYTMATAISADGRFVAGMVDRIGETENEEDFYWCVVWDTKTGKAIHDPLLKASHGDLPRECGVRVLAFSDDSKLLASLTRVDQVGVFDVKSGRRIETLKLPDYGIKEPYHRPMPSILQFSADGQRLYVGTINGGLFIWNQPGKLPAKNRKPSQVIPLSKLLE